MKCPKCQNPPIQFVQFAVRMMPLKTNCEHCNTPLKADFFIKAAYYLSVLFAILFGLRIVDLQVTLGWGWQQVLLAVVGFIVGVVLIVSGIAWKFGQYQLDRPA
jgi:hypothetical protein